MPADKEKTTALTTSVGADDGRSLTKCTGDSITDEAEEISTTIKAIFTPELLNNLTNMGADALEKYADITHSGNRHTIHLDNAAFVAMIDELFTSVANEFVINIKDTSVMFIIGFIDFFAVHRTIVGNNNLYFPSAAIEMVGYLTLTLVASALLRLAEKKMDGASSYELVQTDALAMSAGTYSHPDRGSPFDEQSKEFREKTRQSLKFGRPKGDR